MSLFLRRSRLLSLAPSVITGEGWLRATTHGFWVALSLLSYRREVYVDARHRRIIVRERSCWRTREKRLSFDAVDHIEYGFEDFRTSGFLTSESGRMVARSADSVERFYVGLVQKDGGRQPLFSFVGDGERMTGALGVLLGDRVVDFAGEQEQDSLTFVRQLQKLTGLRLGPALPGRLLERGQKCAACGHANGPRAKCLYCGG